MNESINVIYKTQEGKVPFWDSPFVIGTKNIPERIKYRPKLTHEAVESLFQRTKYKEIDAIIMKVVADSICCTEEQLRRYMYQHSSRSYVSKTVNRFRNDGILDRWKLEDTEYEHEEIISGPLTLGIGGYKYLKHYYYRDFMMNPNNWDALGIPFIQKMVSLNELRVQLYERSVMREWCWAELYYKYSLIHYKYKHLKKYKALSLFAPTAITHIDTPKGRMEWLIIRGMMRFNFMEHVRDRLFAYKQYFEEHGSLPFISENTIPYVVVSVSTRTMAEDLHKKLLLDTFPFPLWCCVDEYVWKDGIEKAIMIPDGQVLRRAHLPFLDKGEK